MSPVGFNRVTSRTLNDTPAYSQADIAWENCSSDSRIVRCYTGEFGTPWSSSERGTGWCERGLCRRPAIEVTASLPQDRVTRAQPFEATGVDFAGPLLVKGENGLHKSYVTLFTCAVTRVIHFELVRDIFTKSFLMALRRFTSRRGVPRTIYSDDALSFKKANRDLQQLWSAIRDPEVLGYVTNVRIKWKFIVERAPWWGGFYERLVGSTKLSLKKAIGARCLNFDKMGNNTDRDRGGIELETAYSRLRRTRRARATLSVFLFDGQTTDDAAKHREERCRRCSHRPPQVLDPPTDDNGSLLAPMEPRVPGGTEERAKPETMPRKTAGRG